MCQISTISLSPKMNATVKLYDITFSFADFVHLMFYVTLSVTLTYEQIQGLKLDPDEINRP